MPQTKEQAIQAVKDAVKVLNIALDSTDKFALSVYLEQRWHPMTNIKTKIGKSAPIRAFITETTSY